MSLSFVKSAVLSSTDGVSHNEETTIDNQETKSIRSAAASGAHKPLFEQLRANKEAQDAKDDEFQRSLRGMATLNDEDCAHLNAMERQKIEMEYQVKSGIEREVALFHAAREDRGLVQTVVEEGAEGGEGDDGAKDANKKKSSDDYTQAAVTKVPAAASKATIVPKFTIKKKRKRVDAHQSQDDDGNIVQKKSTTSGKEKEEVKQTKDDTAANVDGKKGEDNKLQSSPPEEKTESNVADLLGLGCYGSDSD